MRNSLRKFFLILTIIVALSSASAMAQIQYGFRLGYTDDDPKQAHAGVHIVSPTFFKVMNFRPNFDVGLARVAKLYAANFEVTAKYTDYSQTWSGYVGGGPAINIHKTNPTALVETGTRAGVNFIIGVENASGLFLEAKAGIHDSPSYKATVGYTFRRKY
jgi:hypothetical protein